MGEVNLSKRILAALVLFTTGAVASAGPASVRVSQPNFQSPRPLDDQTKNTVIKDYLQSWQVMANALEQNRPDLIDGAFIGSAKADLVSTIQQQTAIGIRTRYHDR